MIRETETGGLQLEEGKNGAQTNTDIGKKLKKARSLHHILQKESAWWTT